MRPVLRSPPFLQGHPGTLMPQKHTINRHREHWTKTPGNESLEGKTDSRFLAPTRKFFDISFQAASGNSIHLLALVKAAEAKKVGENGVYVFGHS